VVASAVADAPLAAMAAAAVSAAPADGVSLHWT
jgi:hypothetical protein